VTASKQPTGFDQAVKTLQAVLDSMPNNDGNVIGPRGTDGPPDAVYIETLTAIAEGLVDLEPGHKWTGEDRRTGLAALGAFLGVLQASDATTGAYLRYHRPWLTAFVNTLAELKAK
jgi:hypothetical protein